MNTKQILEGKKVTQDIITDHAKDEIEKGLSVGIPHELIILIEREAQGGPCPRCSKQWRRIEVHNRFADFHYFVPDCHCYSVCTKQQSMVYRKKGKQLIPTGRFITKGCGQSKHREDALGISKCISCGYDPYASSEDTPETDQIKHYEKAYGVKK